MYTDVVAEFRIVDKFEASHCKGKVGKLIVDLLPAFSRNGVLDGVWNDVSSI